MKWKTNVCISKQDTNLDHEQLPQIQMKKSTKIRRLLNGKHLIGAENQRFHSHALKKKSEWWECKTENCAVATVTTVSKINEIQ